MSCYAQLENNIVQQVIVADSKEWCEENLGGIWIETFKNNSEKNYAGIGYTYYPEKLNFACPQPFTSWTLDENCKWQPPVPRPSESARWDEENQQWITL